MGLKEVVDDGDEIAATNLLNIINNFNIFQIYRISNDTFIPANYVIFRY